jgi:hypothetical protein
MKGRPAFLPWMAKQIYEQVIGDVRHATLDLTATRCMGCPRQEYIQNKFEYVLDPTKQALRVRGTINHKGAQECLDEEYWYTELNDPVRMTIDGEFAGRKVSMKADAVKRDLSEIVDMKFPMDFSVRWRGDVAKKEHGFQLNLARHLLGQQDWATEAGYDMETVQGRVYCCSDT